MKKIYSLFAMALLGVASASAQMIAYDVQTTTTSYTDITGGTVVDLQGTVGTDFSKLIIDAEGNMNFNTAEDVKGFPIGFDFAYNGQAMKYFLIGTDGIIQLSPTETCTTDVHKNTASVFTNAGNHDAFGIALRNGNYGLDDTEISYCLEGEEGSKVLCIQYKNIGLRTNMNNDAEYCAKASIQYRLYQKDGNVEMKVNGFEPTLAEPGRFNFMRIGILGDSKDFVQVQSYDGSTISASDNSISYATDSYPADGTTYTFVAPEACATPATAPSDLVLTSTSTQISGTFTVGAADFYLVLATTEAELSEKPADKAKYTLNQEVGNAKVIAIVQEGEFTSPQITSQLMTPGTKYNVFVYGYNSMCMGGPLYNATPATASIVTKPDAPAELTLIASEKNSVTLSVKATGDAPVLIALSDRMELNSIGQGLDHGRFGVPSGNYSVGDVIDYEYEVYENYEPVGTVQAQNTVVYVGGSNDAIEITGLEAGKDYYFRAWSSDGEGAYSSVYLDLSTITVSVLPWSFVPDMLGGFEPVGWSFDGKYTWTNNPYVDPPYFNSQISFTDTEQLKETWMESPGIELGAGANTLNVDLAASMFTFRTFAAPTYEMQDGEEIAVQLTKDGETYVNILTINKDNMPAVEANEEEEIEAGNYFLNNVFTTYNIDFSEYAGETVKLRFYIKRYTNGAVQIANLSLTNKGGEQGAEATVTYALQVDETHPSGDVVDVKNADEVVASLIFGEEGGDAFKAAKADSHIEGFVAYTEGNGVNGNKTGGTFYTIVPAYDGSITVGVVLNADKSFYVEEDGTALEAYNGIKVDEKYYGTFTFDVKANSSYKFYCAGSKLGFYGFNYTYTTGGTTVGIETIEPSQPAVQGIFTLSGQRLEKPQRGLNIINGRKVMVK